MPGEDTQVAGPNGARRHDELPFFQSHGLSAHDAGIGDPALQGEGQYEVAEALAEERQNSDGDEQGREGPNHLDDLLYQEVDAPTKISRDYA